MGGGTDVIIAFINNPRALQWVVGAVLSLAGVNGYQWFDTTEKLDTSIHVVKTFSGIITNQHEKIVTKTTIVKTDAPRLRSIEQKVGTLQSQVERWHGEAK